MTQLQERLATRFEDEICRICVHRTAGGGCSLTADDDKCPVFRWSMELAALVSDIDSDRLADYLDNIQGIVCPQCAQDETGRCASRDHLDCPVDLYLGLVVDILEDELHARNKAS